MHKCCVCGKPAEAKREEDECNCVCPRCGNMCFDDQCLTDHGRCYDCQKKWQVGELKDEETTITATVRVSWKYETDIEIEVSEGTDDIEIDRQLRQQAEYDVGMAASSGLSRNITITREGREEEEEWPEDHDDGPLDHDGEPTVTYWLNRTIAATEALDATDQGFFPPPFLEAHGDTVSNALDAYRNQLERKIRQQASPTIPLSQRASSALAAHPHDQVLSPDLYTLLQDALARLQDLEPIPEKGAETDVQP